ncbi:putative D-alanine--D-alanine ligase [Cocos nucifera]|uniref:Putative D-alanine--D-alanine ligase n=1 Tax=Cocos nucifera TaxID=13894 RepID=A0A8K0N461_COCNU|nr:putative D-alanine--D-alanine ligase [Cocos nucifera]
MGFVVFCLVYYLAGLGGAAATRGRVEESKRRVHSAISEMRGPGFLYSRTTGRCTPQFWGSGREAWPNMVPQEASVSKVFGSRVLERYEPALTLLEATQRNDDVGGNAFSKLVKQSSAALLNAYTRPGFAYSAWEVKTMLLEALVSDEAAASQAKLFEEANQACT